MRAILAAGLFLFTALAGCADAPSEQEQFVEAVEEGVAADLPPWEVGMWWEYESTGGVSKFIVSGEQGGDYILDTNDRRTAYFDALYDISFLGQVRKSDLAGSQGNQRIAMFDWPLTEDKEWTTEWDGVKLAMKANAMGENQFHVMGHRATDGKMMVEYHYNANVAWFEYIIFYSSETGEEQFRMNLRDRGFDYSGAIFRYTIGETVEFEVTADQSNIHDIPIDAEWNELNMTILGDCHGDGQGQIIVGLNSPEGRDETFPMLPMVNEPEHGVMVDCANESADSSQFVVTNNGGDWEMGAIVGAPNGRVTLTVEQRTLETIQL